MNFTPTSSKVLFKIFRDSNIYTAKSRLSDGSMGPSTNHYTQDTPSSSFVACASTIYQSMAGIYSGYSALIGIFYVFFGIYALVHDRHVCNVDMIHDNSDVWVFGSIYLLTSVFVGLCTEVFRYNVCQNLNSFSVDVFRISIHVLLSLFFIVYATIVLSDDDAMCDEIYGSPLYYWCYVTYYLLVFRIINFCLALVTLCIHKVNEGPIDDADIEKQRLMNLNAAMKSEG